MGIRRIAALVVPALVALAAPECRSRQPTVVIGLGLPLRAGLPLAVAVRDISRMATPGDGAVRIAVDSGSAVDAAEVEARRAESLVAIPGMVGVVGHSSSRGSLVAAPIYNEAGVVQVTPIATSRLLRTAGRWTFNLAPDDSIEGAFIGGFAAGPLKARRVAIYFVNDEYGLGLRDGVTSELARRGVRVVDQVAMDPSSDFETLVSASLARARPDVVVVAGRQAQTGDIARLYRAHGAPRAVVGGDGALMLPQLADTAGAAADSVYAVAFWLPDAPDSLSRAFVASYRRLVGGTPQSADAMTYDALMLLATAARASGGKPAAVRGYLESLGRTLPPYRGVTGEISFTRTTPPRLLMVRLRAGQPVRVAYP